MRNYNNVKNSISDVEYLKTELQKIDKNKATFFSFNEVELRLENTIKKYEKDNYENHKTKFGKLFLS